MSKACLYQLTLLHKQYHQHICLQSESEQFPQFTKNRRDEMVLTTPVEGEWCRS